MKLGFLASGKGSNIKSILRAIDEGRLDAEPTPPLFTLTMKDEFIRDYFVEKAVDFVLCCGYLKKIGPLMLKTFPNQILNIHPSLLPKYGGKGMYGLKVHQAVLDAGDVYSGATVHIVNSEYDRGKILGNIWVKVFSNDTAEKLQKAVFRSEEILYVRVLNDI